MALEKIQRSMGPKQLLLYLVFVMATPLFERISVSVRAAGDR